MNNFEFDQTKLAAFLSKAQQQVNDLEEGLKLITASGFVTQTGINKTYSNEEHVRLANYRLWSNFLNGKLHNMPVLNHTLGTVYRIFDDGVTQDQADQVADKLNHCVEEATKFVSKLAKTLDKKSFSSPIKIQKQINFRDETGIEMTADDVVEDLILSIIWLSGKEIDITELTEFQTCVKNDVDELDLDELYGFTLTTAQNGNRTIKISKEIQNALNSALK